MWKDVFGPALADSKSLLQNTGSNYTSDMNAAISGAHMSPQQASQQRASAKSMGDLMQNLAGSQYSAAVTSVPYDTLISGLSTLTAQATLAREAQERAVAYGVGQSAAAGAGQTGQPAANTANSIANGLASLGLTGPSQ
jgi:hypothetical protein